MTRKTFTLLLIVLLGVLSLTACGKTSSPAPSAPAGKNGAAATDVDTDGDGIPDSAEAVLGTDPNNPDTDGDGQNDLADKQPVFAENPIQETSTTQGFTISGLLVENNTDANGAPVADHLEFKVTNTGSQELSNFDIYYTITDPKTGTVQGYYRTLPGFTIKPGETKTIHFDNTGAPDHFSVNPNSAYYTDVNGLTIEVTLHSPGFAPQTASVNKDPGGLEGGGD